jgi:hypothetical protein
MQREKEHAYIKRTSMASKNDQMQGEQTWQARASITHAQVRARHSQVGVGHARTKGTHKQGHGTRKQGQDMRNKELCQRQLCYRINHKGRHAQPGAIHAHALGTQCLGGSTWAMAPDITTNTPCLLLLISTVPDRRVPPLLMLRPNYKCNCHEQYQAKQQAQCAENPHAGRKVYPSGCAVADVSAGVRGSGQPPCRKPCSPLHENLHKFT